jgi:hypothetical protein
MQSVIRNPDTKIGAWEGVTRRRPRRWNFAGRVKGTMHLMKRTNENFNELWLISKRSSDLPQV